MKFPRRNKYRVAPKSRRTDATGKTYASRSEMRYAAHLRTLIAAKEIVAIEEQPRLTLGIPENVYVPDFKVTPVTGDPYYVDVKGAETAAFRQNLKLWKVYGPAELRVVRPEWGKFKTTRVVPKGSKAP